MQARRQRLWCGPLRTHDTSHFLRSATGCDYNHELNIGPAHGNERRRFQHRWQNALHFLATTAGQQRDHRQMGIKFPLSAKLRAIVTSMNFAR